VEAKKNIVILPTFNEAGNIEKIIKSLYTFNVDILVVDDNSPDNTASIVKKMMLSNKRIDILQRPEKLGLGSAYRDGFKYSIEKGYKNLIQMDADFSHRIKDLKVMLNSINDYEVIIGSRYINGGDSIGWSKSRKLLSKFANIYARKVTGCKINDMTSGFRIYSSNALNTMQYNVTKSNGYGFQIEMSSKAYYKKLSIIEVPIIFNERREGESKMNFRIIIEALLIVLKLRFFR